MPDSDMAMWLADDAAERDMLKPGVVGGTSFCHAGNEGSACEYFVWFDGRGGMALVLDTGSAYFTPIVGDAYLEDNAAMAARIAELLLSQMRWIEDASS